MYSNEGCARFFSWLFIIFIGLCLLVLVASYHTRPCSDFKYMNMGSVPARCIEYFMKKD